MSLSQVFYIDAPDGLPAEAPRGSEGLLAYDEMVLRKGLEPLCLAAHAPQACVSTNSTT